ncbi:radical SAM protein [Nitrospinae bacterium AH_259_B05_G02_I21]|nr:radical SAM protein [Nitrospinae bacterium AH_259_B05_G02_I21]MDA2931921.1 radical SAM protein [Nitrospinae bacterium AH-259-F20]
MKMLTASDLREVASVWRRPFTWRQKVNFLHAKLARRGKVVAHQPVTLSIVATGRCNLTCTMCPTHSSVIPVDYEWNQQMAEDIDFETFKRTVDRFDRAIYVNIIGAGEPLLNKNLFRIAKYAAVHKKMVVKTFSNGTTLERYIEPIVRSHLDGITVSINAHNSEEFNRITGMPGLLYPKIYKNVKRLVEARNALGSPVKIKASFIIDQQNWPLIPEFLRVADEVGVDQVFLCNFLSAPFDGFRAEERSLFVQDTDMVEFLRTVVPSNMQGKVVLPTLLDPAQTTKQCSCHFDQLRVDGAQNFSSCSIMLLNMEGNGKITDAEVWNSTFFQNRRARFLTDDKSVLFDPCKVCPENYGVNPW